MGVEGGASLGVRPGSSNIARTLPNTEPQMKKSPGLSGPFCTSTVATGPRPLSTRDSRTVPLAGASGLAFNSRKSATNKMISSSLSMPFFCLAETSTNSVSPPHSAGISPRSDSCRFTLSGCASGLSILLIATTIGTFAALAWSMASLVYVAHNGYDRGPRFQTFLSLFLRDFQNHFLFQGHDAYDAIEGFRQRRRRGHIERLVDAGKHAAVEQRFQQVFRAHVELLRELANGDAFGDGHFARRTRFGRCNHRRGGRRPAA